MVDRLSPTKRSALMAKIRSANTGPEIAVRRMLRRLGYRGASHSKDLPGKPDVVLRSIKKAIFVHGCFWHGHACPWGMRQPKSNKKFWMDKLKANRARDKRTCKDLRKMGWDVLVVWQCQLKKPHLLEKRISSWLIR